MATRSDIEDDCSIDHFCVDLKRGIEQSIQAMSDLFDANIDCVDVQGLLLIDASNTFNSLNCTAMLLHARVLWPCCSCFHFNSYCGWSVLALQGSIDFLYSKEGVTHGDPLSLFMNVIGTVPLICSLCDSALWTQI